MKGARASGKNAQVPINAPAAKDPPATADTEASRESSPDALKGGLKQQDIDDSPPSRLKQIQLEDFERTMLHRAKVYARRTQKNTPEEDLVYYEPTTFESLGPWIALRAVFNYTSNTLQRIWPPSKDWLSLTFWIYNITLIIVAVLFTCLQMAFWFWEAVLPQAWIKGITDYANDTIVIQRLFNNMTKINAASAKALSQPAQDKTFNPAVAEFLLNMASAVYVRDPFIYTQAEQYYQEAFFLDGCKISSFRSLSTADNFTRKKLSAYFRESVAPIVKLTDQLNVSYHLISELETGFGGPYASLMASKSAENPFIVVVFKGTSPLSLDEWLIDFNYAQVSGGKFFRGDCHQGFFTCLFPDKQDSCERSEDRLNYYPYQTLVEAINLKADKMAAAFNVEKIPVWVAGHSLGAGVATLFYGWLLNNTNTLSKTTTLCDAYTYGNPATGNQEYARGYFATFAKHEGKMLWRMICDSDMVSRVPLNKDTAGTGGVGEPSLTGVRENSYLNYAAPGNGIRIFSDRAPLLKGSFEIAEAADKAVHGSEAQLGTSLALADLARWIPGAKFLVDHAPTRYAECLRFSRGKYQIPPH
ncbi:Alpha/Beta hydrolase protein [Protomyces lactucae-debilis]|uniref:Alpha/Beta hydrolase protein n=1 Tax=Protomyces lactucae-debilis TaxID=2754530 RepID=A0A1Y2F2R9_PROLT|nr:Alpha/Beta hydrolase protein [Protomyces lactucae-debilis]ORY78190.1 Alpha/Beta hydrolase protein [Protomyces lactucae-debilis]